MSGFTDKLIKDLSKSEQDARRFRVSRWEAVKEVVRDMWDSSAGVALLTFVLGPLVFLGSACLIYNTPIMIARSVSDCMTVFERRGLEVVDGEMISTAMSKIPMTYFEFIVGAEEAGDTVYYTGRPKHYFYFTNEYEDIAYLFLSEDIEQWRDPTMPYLIFMVAGVVGVIMTREIYKEYGRLRKEEVET